MVWTSSWMWSTKQMGLDFRKHLRICEWAQNDRWLSIWTRARLYIQGQKNIWNHSKGRVLRTESWPSKEPWVPLWVIPKDKLKAFCIKKNANKLLAIFKVQHWRESRNFCLALTGTPRISASRLSSQGSRRVVGSALLDEARGINREINRKDGPPRLKRKRPRKTQPAWMKLFANV